jgi:lipoprotein-releasing system ATP-binding protein
MAERTLELRGVRKEYVTGEVVTPALHGIDLVLGRGEFTALVGPSGSGKSTLLHLVGLLDRPSGGSVVLDGVDTGALGDRALTRYRGRTVGFVFQFHHLLPEFTALENVTLPMMADRGRVEPEMEECASRLLAQVGLGEKLHRRPAQLSGGEQQRVAIARALAMSPRLVVADEPTGNLDTQSSDDVFALLREVNRGAGVTFLVVSHDRRLAERCDRIVEIVDGRLVSDRRVENPR